MNMTRCDDCCSVLDGVDDGIVYECSEEIYKSIFLEHICKDCLERSEDLILTNPSPYCYIVDFKNKRNNEG